MSFRASNPVMSTTCAARHNTVNVSSDRAERAGKGADEQGRNETDCPERSDNPWCWGFHSLSRRTHHWPIWVLVTGPLQVGSWVRWFPDFYTKESNFCYSGSSCKGSRFTCMQLLNDSIAWFNVLFLFRKLEMQP